jgi:hypothetical protein
LLTKLREAVWILRGVLLDERDPHTLRVRRGVEEAQKRLRAARLTQCRDAHHYGRRRLSVLVVDRWNSRAWLCSIVLHLDPVAVAEVHYVRLVPTRLAENRLEGADDRHE